MGTLQKTRLTVSLIVSYLKRDVYSRVSRVSCQSCELMADRLDGGKQLRILPDFNDDRVLTFCMPTSKVRIIIVEC